MSELCMEMRASKAQGGRVLASTRVLAPHHHHAGEAREPNTRPAMVQIYVAPDSVREGVGRGRGDASTALQRLRVPSPEL
jgi:hypothetical protein